LIKNINFIIKRPVLAINAFVAPSASVVGDVALFDNASVSDIFGLVISIYLLVMI